MKLIWISFAAIESENWHREDRVDVLRWIEMNIFVKVVP